jgi:alpha-mannosidase
MKYIHPSSECRGRNNFKYSLYIHNEQEYNMDSVIRYAKGKIYKPDVGIKLGYDHEGSFSNECSMLTIEGEAVLVSAFCMDDGKYLLRLYETKGESNRVVIKPFYKFRVVNTVDFLGSPLKRDGMIIDQDIGSIEIVLKPREIVNLAFE